MMAKMHARLCARPSLRSTSHASMPGGLAPVDVQNLTGDERGAFEIQDAVDDVADLADPADGFRVVARRPREQRLRPAVGNATIPGDGAPLRSVANSMTEDDAGWGTQESWIRPPVGSPLRHEHCDDQPRVGQGDDDETEIWVSGRTKTARWC
jgi:hypothetical protein